MTTPGKKKGVSLFFKVKFFYWTCLSSRVTTQFCGLLNDMKVK